MTEKRIDFKEATKLARSNSVRSTHVYMNDTYNTKDWPELNRNKNRGFYLEKTINECEKFGSTENRVQTNTSYASVINR